MGALRNIYFDMKMLMYHSVAG